MNEMIKPAGILTLCGLGLVHLFVSPVNAQDLGGTKTSGPVAVTTSLTPSQPTIGDEVTLTIEVKAEKDVEVLMPEFGEALERYTIVEFVPRQNIAPDGSITLSQQYTLQPILSGEQSIPPILIEFVDNRPGSQSTPDDFDAYEILTDRIDFTVQSVVPKNATNELKPPMGDLELRSDTSSNTRWFLFLTLAGVPVVAAAVCYWRRSRRRAIRINAYVAAKMDLNRLLEDRNSPAPKLSIEQFFVEISGIIRNYIEDLYDVRAPELTTDEFLQLAAGESQMSREHQSLLSEFLKQADIVKFAGVQATTEEVQRSSDLALRFLEETRESAPDIEVDELDSAPRNDSGKANVKTDSDASRRETPTNV